jgi:hypothetical protein
MNKTQYTIYWMLGGYPNAMQTNDMAEAMRQMESMRKCPGYSAITFCSENPDQVGKPGVDTVKDGVLPDGQEYVYKTGRDRGRDPR